MTSSGRRAILTMSGAHIRTATLHDARRLAELTTTLGYAVGPDALCPRLERTLARAESHPFYEDLAYSRVKDAARTCEGALSE